MPNMFKLPFPNCCIYTARKKKLTRILHSDTHSLSSISSVATISPTKHPCYINQWV